MARIAAGARNRFVWFYPIATAEDALGTERAVDFPPFKMTAAVSFGSGAERREAGQAGTVQTATFRVLACAALKEATERWEIEFSSARWGITSIVPIDNDDTEIEFTATRKGA